MALKSRRGLRRILVQIDCFARHNFARIIVAASWAHMVRALKIAAVRAFLWVASNQSIMRAAHVALRAGYAILRDSHVTPFLIGGHAPDFQR
jgi:hypothetical protein